MKTLASILLITGMLGLSKVGGNRMFSGKEHQEYLVDAVVVDENNDGIGDFILAGYDLNKNKKMDTYAFFRIKYQNDTSIVTDEYSRIVMSDVDEDGEVDYRFIDIDGDYILDIKESLQEESLDKNSGQIVL